jgi:hypothetical protein
MLQSRERSDVPIAANALQQLAPLFDHLVGAGKNHGWDGKAERISMTSHLPRVSVRPSELRSAVEKPDHRHRRLLRPRCPAL